MIAVSSEQGVKTIEAGALGNLDEKNYRQLWMEDFTGGRKSHTTDWFEAFVL